MLVTVNALHIFVRSQIVAKKIWYVNFSSSCYFHLVNTSCMQIMVAEFYFSLACIQYTSIHLKSFKISFAKSIGYM